MKQEILYRDPRVVLVRGFLSDGERHALVQASQGIFRPSAVTCDKPGGCVTNHRTSKSAYLRRSALTGAVAARGLRLAGLQRAEDLQIVRYEPGEEFKPHLDAFDPSTDAGQREIAAYGGQQREATVLIYLSGPKKGGETVFPRLGLKVKPIMGAALFWKNILPSGEVDPYTLHAGSPVVSGVKYAANLWMRGGKRIS